MAFEQRDNSGTLSRNERKEKQNHPDHRGSATIDGKEYWISAWIKEGPRGKFFSLAFQPKEEQKLAESRTSQPGDSTSIFDDDVPF